MRLAIDRFDVIVDPGSISGNAARTTSMLHSNRWAQLPSSALAPDAARRGNRHRTLPPGISQQTRQSRGGEGQNAGLGHGLDARTGTRAEVGQHDRQVVDVHPAVAVEVARGSKSSPLWPKLVNTMVRSLTSTLPSQVGVAGDRRRDRGVEARVLVPSVRTH